MRTKLDNRIRTLIENGVGVGHRSMFAIVGDKGRDQVLLFLLLDVITEKTLNATCSLTAARGRGKSASLGCFRECMLSERIISELLSILMLIFIKYMSTRVISINYLGLLHQKIHLINGFC
uniref:ATP synthase alpha chain n=1 Tax=Heterorhabditis bacteriophora TaxID=37862 RepID=A0A1I7WB55_HETBA